MVGKCINTLQALYIKYIIKHKVYNAYLPLQSPLLLRGCHETWVVKTKGIILDKSQFVPLIIFLADGTKPPLYESLTVLKVKLSSVLKKSIGIKQNIQ